MEIQTILFYTSFFLSFCLKYSNFITFFFFFSVCQITRVLTWVRNRLKLCTKCALPFLKQRHPIKTRQQTGVDATRARRASGETRLRKEQTTGNLLQSWKWRTEERKNERTKDSCYELWMGSTFLSHAMLFVWRHASSFFFG